MRNFSSTPRIDRDLEIELWEDTSGRTRPWDAEAAGSLERRRWVMDRDGSSLVRFDVTTLARDWLSGAKTNQGILLRLRPDQAARDMVLAESPHMKLIYHVVSVDR